MRVPRRTLFRFLLAGDLVCCLITSVLGQTQKPVLTLEEAIQLGLRHHPAAKNAAANILQAKAALAEARVMAVPTVGASEEAIVSNDPVFAFGTKLRQARFGASDFALPSLNHPSAIGNFASIVNANWIPFDSGVTRKRIRSDQTAVQEAGLSSDYTKQEIAVNVTTLYYRALLADAQVNTAQTDFKRAQEITAEIRDRVRAGLALEADGMRADLTVRSEEDDLESTEANVQLAREDLFSAIGQPRSDVALTAPSTDSSAPVLNATTVSLRPDLRALDLKRTSAQQNLASIRATVGPTLSTFAQVESDNPHFSGGGSNNWTVGAKLQISVFDGGARKAREQEAAAQIAKVDAEKALKILDAHNKMRALQAQIEDLGRRYATAGLAIQAEQEALKASRDRYAAGLVAASEVLTGEAHLSSAELDQLRCRYEIRIAQTELQFVSGILTTSKENEFQ